MCPQWSRVRKGRFQQPDTKSGVSELLGDSGIQLSRSSARLSPRHTIQQCMFIGRTASFGLFAAALFLQLGCSQRKSSQEPAFKVDVSKPDLYLATWEASGQSDPSGINYIPLLYEKCEKIYPIVRPINQVWSCHFKFNSNGNIRSCSAIMSIHPDNHWSFWDIDWRLDAKTGRYASSLECNETAQ